jgi:hypothetical protein
MQIASARLTADVEMVADPMHDWLIADEIGQSTTFSCQ